MSEWRRWLRMTLTCGGLVGLYFAVPTSPHPSEDSGLLRGLIAVACLVLLAAGIIWQLRLQIDHGMDRRVDGLITSVVAVVIFFSFAYFVMEKQDPDQLVGIHTRVDALYFTMTTTTTVGYGDVHAAGQVARALVVVQMVFNVVFIATAAALLSARVKAAAVKRSEARAASRQTVLGDLDRSSAPDDAAEADV